MWTSLLLVTALAATSQGSNLYDTLVRRDIERMVRVAQGHIDNRIVGGQEAKPHQYPWQVGMYIHLPEGRAFCGGSLISPQWVLTASHCAQGVSKFEIILGAHNITNVNEPSQQRFESVEKVVYNSWGFALYNDIALVKLPTPAKINEFVRPISLPHGEDAGDLFEGRRALMSGWGRSSDAATGISTELRYVESEVVPNWNCALHYLSPTMWFRKNNICVSGKGGKGTCNGDSGGPLVVFSDDGQPLLAGITSFGIALGCEVGWPPAFTRVTSYLGWIQEHSGVKATF